MTVIPIVTGALGTVSKGLVQALEDMEMRERMETIKTTALLKSARILRREVLETPVRNHRIMLVWKNQKGVNNEMKIKENEKTNKYLDLAALRVSYEVHTISFQNIFVRTFKIVIDSWKSTMLLLYIIWDDWPIVMIFGLNEQPQQQLEYTLLKPDCHC